MSIQFDPSSALSRFQPLRSAEQEAQSAPARPEQEATQARTEVQPSRVSRTVAAAESAQLSETFSLDLVTQDGDKVSINFASNQSYSAGYAATDNGKGGYGAAFEINRSSSQQFSYSVEGELDDDELKAIDDLVKDMGRISDKFFDGNVQKAFEMASEYEMDKTELSSMRFEITRTQSYSRAASYEEIGQMGDPRRDAQPLMPFMDDFQQSSQKPDLDFISAKDSLSMQILSQLVVHDQRYLEATEEEQQKYDDNLELMQSLNEQPLEAQTPEQE